MDMNQNEILDFSGPQRPTTSAQHPVPSAFTLVELLVVIAIIGILASLITAAAVKALDKAHQTRILLEIDQLSGAMEDFKNEYGAYPPNGMQDGTNLLAVNDFVRMFRKAFPRQKENPDVIRALAGINPGGGKSRFLPGGLSAAEAIYFWLGGFSSDPQYPISGPGGPAFDTTLPQGEVIESRQRRYEFDLGRLEPRNSDGAFHNEDDGGTGRYIFFDHPVNGNRYRINFWQYAPEGSQQPLVYFDVSRHKPERYDLHALGIPAPGTPMIHAIEKVREGHSGTRGPSDLVFVNQGKFQILHAGTDDEWGSFMPLSLLMVGNATDVITFPEGPFIGDLADTLTNFTTGTLEDAQE